MREIKSKGFYVRLKPSVHKSLEELAEKENRSYSNLIEMLIIERAKKLSKKG